MAGQEPHAFAWYTAGSTVPPGPTNHAGRRRLVQLIIPGRPQSRRAKSNGELLDTSGAFLARVKTLSAPLRVDGRPRYPGGQVPVTVHLFYVVDNPQRPPTEWHEDRVPRPDTAANLILTGLSGRLYAHPGQVNPFTVHRYTLPLEEATKRFGPDGDRGGTIITWEDPS